MNVYFVLSERLPALAYTGPPEAQERRHIAELVIARSPSQAKYMAWKADQKACGYQSSRMAEMPRFRCIQLGVVAEGDSQRRRIVSNEAYYLSWWEETTDIEAPD